MGKNARYVVLVIIAAAAAAAAAWLMLLPKEQTGNQGSGAKRLEDIKPPLKEQQGTISSADKTAAVQQARSEGIQAEFKKCFKKETSASSVEAMKSTILQQKEFSSPSLTEERYDLTTDDKKNLVVEFIPQEENKNKVRVFSINPEDGLPDRIKDFPQNGSEVSLRLKGALSLGSVKEKTTSTTQSSYDGSLLSLDETNGKVVRLHLITTAFDFECKEQSCLCLKKE